MWCAGSADHESPGASTPTIMTATVGNVGGSHLLLHAPLPHQSATVRGFGVTSISWRFFFLTYDIVLSYEHDREHVAACEGIPQCLKPDGGLYTEWGKITSLNFNVNNQKTIRDTKILFLDSETTTWDVLNHIVLKEYLASRGRYCQ